MIRLLFESLLSFLQKDAFCGECAYVHLKGENKKKMPLSDEKRQFLEENCKFRVFFNMLIYRKIILKNQYIEKLLKKAPIFKQLYPHYANYDIYLGLAAFHFEKGAEEESIEQGIAVIKQVGDNMVVYDENLKVF